MLPLNARICKLLPPEVKASVAATAQPQQNCVTRKCNKFNERRKKEMKKDAIVGVK